MWTEPLVGEYMPVNRSYSYYYTIKFDKNANYTAKAHIKTILPGKKKQVILHNKKAAGL
jgi:hypothetical protein